MLSSLLEAITGNIEFFSIIGFLLIVILIFAFCTGCKSCCCRACCCSRETRATVAMFKTPKGSDKETVPKILILREESRSINRIPNCLIHSPVFDEISCRHQHHSCLPDTEFENRIRIKKHCCKCDGSKESIEKETNTRPKRVSFEGDTDGKQGSSSNKRTAPNPPKSENNSDLSANKTNEKHCNKNGSLNQKKDPSRFGGWTYTTATPNFPASNATAPVNPSYDQTNSYDDQNQEQEDPTSGW